MFIIMFAIYFNANSQINYTVNLSSTDLSINPLTASDNNTYSFVSFTKLYASGDTGKPILPVKVLHFYIPEGKDIDNISITTSSAITYSLSSKVFPAQKSIPISTTSTYQDFTKADSTIYNSNNAWPYEMVKMVDKGYFGGRNQIVTIAVIPFQYFPLMNKLDFYSSINITINLKQSTNNNVISSNHSTIIKSMYDNILNKIVVNPTDINFSTNAQTMSSLTMTLPAYEYVIITDATLVNSFASFVDWKKRKGINIGIVTTADIYNSYSSNTIDTHPILDGSGNLDIAARVREYLKDAVINGGTAWALIAGDYSTNVPIRLGCGSIPTDMYFADLNGDWNVDNNSSYGDSPDYYPEIFVGRLICSSDSAIINWTQHVLKYEQNPGNGDYNYVLNAFSIQADEMQQGITGYSPPSQADTVASHLPSFAHNIWGEYPSPDAEYNLNTGNIQNYTPDSTLNGQPGHPKGAEVIGEMNNHYGLYSWFCHGGTGIADNGVGESGIATMSNGLGGYACKVQAQDAHDHPHNILESNNGLDNLNNQNYPSILYTISCDIMPFDITSTNNNNGAMNCGEAFTTLPNTGGVAFLGNTRTGSVGYSYIIYNEFADLINSSNSNSSSEFAHLGISEALSKYYFSAPGMGVLEKYLKFKHNLIGCPETEMWTDTLRNLDVTTTPSCLEFNSNNTITVTINNLPNGNHAKVCLYQSNVILRQSTSFLIVRK